MILSDEQIQELVNIVEYNNALFVCYNIGSEQLSLSDKSILTRRGIDWRKHRETYLDYAYSFGKIAESLRDKKKVQGLDFDQLKGFISSGKFVPLSSQEKSVLSIVKHQCYKDVTGLKNKIVGDLYQISIDAAQKDRYKKIMKQTAAIAIKDRLSVKQFSSMLKDKTQDWSRDFDRIADYVMHSACQHGKAYEMLNNYGYDVKVWYAVKDDACVHCKRIYLNKDESPKIFSLIELIDNGSNIGVKPEHYKPTVYPLHPWCRCEINREVENSFWNNKTKRFEILRNTYGVNRKSKIKITYG